MITVEHKHFIKFRRNISSEEGMGLFFYHMLHDYAGQQTKENFGKENSLQIKQRKILAIKP